MNKENKIVYCKDCNAVKVTEYNMDCIICGKESKEIGFQHDVIQQILDIEGEASNG